ncbi:MAG: SDR family NAD(P)-dependent oxidoreductase, partial [Pseudomonadota bacterium]|nr:SDR family NAD(P)-dependent oxidoreductase [Pseudomonadota bacterium]
MELGLNGKRVIITGASKGIGKAVAVSMGAEGAHLALCARGKESLEETHAELKKQGVTVFSEICDVGEKEQLENFLQNSVDSLGG